MSRPYVWDLHGSGATDAQAIRWSDALARWVPADDPASYSDPLTTKGDLVGRSSSATGRVPVGANGRVLAADSTQTFGIAWTDLSGLYVPLSTVTTKGDLIAGTGSGAVARRSAGSNGQVLVADSTQTTGLNWVSVATDPTTTKGDLLARTASALARLAVGSDGQVLTADAASTSGVKWAAGGAAAASPDDVPGSPGSIDYEFNATTTSLPSGWAWTNQGTSTYREAFAKGVIAIPASAGSNNRIIDRAQPSGSTWTICAKFSMAAASGVTHTGICLRDSSSGKFWYFGHYGVGASWLRWTNPTTYGGQESSRPTTTTSTDAYYLKVVKASASSYSFFLSPDGDNWWQYDSTWNAVDLSAWMTMDRVGWLVNVENAGTVIGMCHWFRQTA